MVQSASLTLLQAPANRLPTLNEFNEFIYTEGNGTPSRVFVASNGVHVYNTQAVVHQEALAFFRNGEVRQTVAAEVVASLLTTTVWRGTRPRSRPCKHSRGQDEEFNQPFQQLGA